MCTIECVHCNSQVCQYPIYAGVIKFIQGILMDNNIEVSWVDSSASVESYEEAIKPNTKVILIMHSWILRTHAHTHTHTYIYTYTICVL